MDYEKQIEAAKEKFEAVLRGQLARVERMKETNSREAGGPTVIGVVGGDGIGPTICAAAREVMVDLLAEKIAAGEIVVRDIEGLTIENRAKCGQAIPDDVMEQLRACDVILKGPTTTPQAGDGWPNIESANVAMRKALDLYANVRPVRVPEKGIDWTFFRENTEGSYAVGSQGIHVTDDLAVDFCVTTTGGTERIARLAYDYARANRKDRVSIVTKANIIKTTDGKFLRLCREIGQEYPEITTDEWYIDIMTAKLIDEKRRTSFRVFILPNLYGDIITDEAAEFQGGVGTAGSANIGTRYAMFEAIHGSAPRMVQEGRAAYADPCSILRATVMLLSHIGCQAESDKLERALDICMLTERKLVITGREDGATCEAFAAYVSETLHKLDA